MSWGAAGWRAGRGVLQAGGLPSDTARGVGSVGQTSACPCLPLALGGAGLEKALGAILPQSHNGEKEQLPHVPLLLCPGKASLEPSPLHPYSSAPSNNSSFYLSSLAPIRSRFQPLVPDPALFPSESPRVPPCQRPVQSHPLSPRYPVAKLPMPSLSHHQQGKGNG